MTRAELLVTAKPILFNTDMVRAILDGRKTVTRRVIKPQPTYSENGGFAWKGRQYETNLPPTIQGAAFNFLIASPYQVGDILYVRETWNKVKADSDVGWHYEYRADCQNPAYFSDGFMAEWRPSIHMPKEAARIFLRVTGVCAERLQDITEEQARAEGIVPFALSADPEGTPENERTWHAFGTALDKYPELWNSTVKKSDLDKYGWDANPWVWVIEFERIEVAQ